MSWGREPSRTTHPRVLAGYSKLFSLLLDTEVHFENPFIWMTKSDIVKIDSGWRVCRPDF